MLPLPAAIDLSLDSLPPAWMVIQSMAAGAVVGLSLGLTRRMSCAAGGGRHATPCCLNHARSRFQPSVACSSR